MPKKRVRRSAEYKHEALRRIVDGKEPVASVAESLGVARETLHRWMREYRATPSEVFPGNGKLTSQDERVRQLVQENARLKEERDILKKALTFFAKEPH
jgi:transposase-like protein